VDTDPLARGIGPHELVTSMIVLTVTAEIAGFMSEMFLAQLATGICIHCYRQGNQLQKTRHIG
jgi:hypothetical protein